MGLALGDSRLVALGSGEEFVFLFGFDTEDAGVATGAISVAFAKGTEELGNNVVGFLKQVSQLVQGQTCRDIAKEVIITYVENLQGPSAAGLSVLLAERDQLVCQSLGFLGLGPCCCD